MEIDVARKKLVDELNSFETFDKWVDILQDTNPANYGVEDVEIDIDYNDIWVDMREKTFTFENAELAFSARLGGSNEESGYDANFKLVVSGNGQFEFINKSHDLRIVDFKINEDLELYPGRE
jgi:hypothetical protein